MVRWKLLLIYMGILLTLYTLLNYESLSFGEAVIIYLLCFQIVHGITNEKKEKELNK